LKAKEKKNEKKNEKGSRKSAFGQFPRSIFKAKEGNIAKPIQKRKKRKRVREKAPFDNFQGQFSRQRKEK
jgi:hypothetical protein